ncbi:uncharacterized protein [Leptinotarsa decemlineata]|uniref:uncharacterized protein n=1 Tax=Leptinotarsa decemlineata TaxID=7539 RepID=UPI003D306BC4
MSFRNQKALTEEELLLFLENDDLSDIAVLSDDDLGWDGSESQHADFMDGGGPVDDPESGSEADGQSDGGLDGVAGPSMVELAPSTVEQSLSTARPGPVASTTESVPLTAGPNVNEADYVEHFYNQHNLTKKGDIVWVAHAQYQTRFVKWHNGNNSTELVIDLSSPVDFFMRYIPNSVFEKMVDMTNMYANQQNIARFPPTNIEEVRKFIGMHIIMRNLQFPRVEMY